MIGVCFKINKFRRLVNLVRKFDQAALAGPLQADRVYNIKNLSSPLVVPLLPLEHRVPDFMWASRWCSLFGAEKSLNG